LAVNWETTSVANEASYTVTGDDVVIMSGHSATITLPSLSDGRVLVIKDTSGTAGTAGQAITINRAGSDKIEGNSSTFSLAADFGAVVLVGNSTDSSSKWHVIALV